MLATNRYFMNCLNSPKYGERKTYSWYYNSFFPTILGFVVEDIFSFVGLSLMATFFSKERIEPHFYFMNAIKWNCILSESLHLIIKYFFMTLQCSNTAVSKRLILIKLDITNTEDDDEQITRNKQIHKWFYITIST